MTSRGRGLVWPIGAAALAVVGGAVAAWGAAQPFSFGWFAYAPLSQTTLAVASPFWRMAFGDGDFVTTPGAVEAMRWGAVVCALGLAAFAVWATLAIRRRVVRLRP